MTDQAGKTIREIMEDHIQRKGPGSKALTSLLQKADNGEPKSALTDDENIAAWLIMQGF